MNVPLWTAFHRSWVVLGCSQNAKMPSHADFLKELLDRLVEGGVPIDAAEKYTERFRGEYLVSLADVATLTEDHHRELGVAIGHRNILRRCTNELSMSHKLMNSIEWVSLTGKHRTLRSFLEEISCVRKSLELPEAFDRLFQDNRPMPFVETIDDSDAFGLLLRVPDIVGKLGASEGYQVLSPKPLGILFCGINRDAPFN